MNNQRWGNGGLGVLLAVAAIAVATTFLERPAQITEKIKYSQFIQQIKQGNVENVGLSSDRTKALAQYKDGTKRTVDLPPDDPQLIDILTANVKGNIYVLPQSEDNNFLFQALRSLFFRN